MCVKEAGLMATKLRHKKVGLDRQLSPGGLEQGRPTGGEGAELAVAGREGGGGKREVGGR